MTGGRPRVTVAVPLHRSAPWVEVVSANLDRLPRRGVEVILSDRTGADDALARLRARHGDDPRVCVVDRPDGVGWVDHCNDLLRQARGTYVMWMPHDDDYPEGYVTVLADALDRHRDAILAFGHLDAIEVDGTPIDMVQTPPPFELGVLDRLVELERLLAEWNLGVLWRGLMRRDEILRRGLTMRHLPDDWFVDVLWASAVVAAAPVRFVPDTRVAKRYHDANTHGAFRFPEAVHPWVPAIVSYTNGLAPEHRQGFLDVWVRWFANRCG